MPETRTLCRICGEHCGLLVSNGLEGLRVRGDKAHPLSKGFLCPKAHKAARMADDPRRLTTPLLQGKDGRHVPITWDTALDILAERLLQLKAEHGSESVGFLSGEALKHQEIPSYLRHLSLAFGSPNFIRISSLCHASQSMAHSMTYGAEPYLAERHRSALIWGANPAVSRPLQHTRLRAAVERGALTLVVADPVLSATAQMAAVHWPVRPGTDGLLALALSRLTLDVHPELFPTHTPAEWLERLRAVDVDAAVSQAGLSLDSIERGMALLWAYSDTWVCPGVGLELQPHGFQTLRAITNLALLLDLGVPGAPCVCGQNHLPGKPEKLAASALGADMYPAFVTRHGAQGMLLPENAIGRTTAAPLRGLLLCGSNPARSFPAEQRFGDALRSLSFLAVYDLFLTPTAQLAELVLPGASFLETMELHDYGGSGHPLLGLTRPVRPANGGRPLWQVIFALARRLGLEAFFPWDDNVQAIRHRLSGLGEPDGLAAFLTSDGGLLAYTPKPRSFKRQFAVDLPERQSLPSALELCPGTVHAPFADYPFRLLTGNRQPGLHNSLFHSAMEFPKLLMHADDAAKRGLVEGARVTVVTPWGELPATLRLGAKGEIQPGVLSLPHGVPNWSANRLTAQDVRDPVTGFPWMKALPADICLAEGNELLHRISGAIR